jgi:hypothetical protein
MGANHKQQLKKLLGHGDYGPVLGTDSLQATSATISGVATHTVLGTFVAPRQTQLKGLTVMAATGALPAGRLDYALTYNGVVAVSGQMGGGIRADAQWLPLDRQSAKVVASGTVIQIVYAVPTQITVNLGTTANTIRFSAPVDYLGQL